MTKLNTWKIVCVVALTVGNAITMPAQTFTTLVSFDGTNGYGPENSLVQGMDGNLYGNTTSGGTADGTIFKMTTDGTLTTLYNFCSQPFCTDGANPQGALVQSPDGNFYGTTYLGGNSCTFYGMCGTVFSMTPQGYVTVTTPTGVLTSNVPFHVIP